MPVVWLPLIPAAEPVAFAFTPVFAMPAAPTPEGDAAPVPPVPEEEAAPPPVPPQADPPPLPRPPPP
jgi:hypothetical protein